MPERALILGIGGQDGYYLTHWLRSRGYEVWGLLRPEDAVPPVLAGLDGQAGLIEGSIADAVLLARILNEIRPAEVYNLAGISFIPLSWEQPALVGQVNGSAVGQILELLRTNLPGVRFFQAGSSEMFGRDPAESPQNLTTPFRPDNPYASAKVFAAHLVSNYRNHFGLFACTGILYNHESPRRGFDFVTRKITRSAAAIRLGLQKNLVLGDIAAQRDWTYAGDMVKAMWLMLQQDVAGDFVLGSGRIHSIKDCLQVAFAEVGLRWEDYVRIDERYIRPAEKRPLLADVGAAVARLGWKAEVRFEELIRMMVQNDLEELRRCGEA